MSTQSNGFSYITFIHCLFFNFTLFVLPANKSVLHTHAMPVETRRRHLIHRRGYKWSGAYGCWDSEPDLPEEQSVL